MGFVEQSIHTISRISSILFFPFLNMVLEQYHPHDMLCTYFAIEFLKTQKLELQSVTSSAFSIVSSMTI